MAWSCGVIVGWSEAEEAAFSCYLPEGAGGFDLVFVGVHAVGGLGAEVEGAPVEGFLFFFGEVFDAFDDDADEEDQVGGVDPYGFGHRAPSSAVASQARLSGWSAWSSHPSRRRRTSSSEGMTATTWAPAGPSRVRRPPS